MKRFFPLARSSGGSPKSSVPGRGGVWRPETSQTSHFTRHVVAGFTLIELLVVIAIIAVLAALTLGTLGYVNKKGAESRARSEVAALSAAIDAYKLDLGSYPASNSLYAELTGQGSLNKGKVYFEPTPTIVNTNTRSFVDPWGNDYRYDPANPAFNVGFFDLWSTAGGTDTNKFIRN